MYLGSWKIDDLLTFPANTHAPTTGAAADADSVPAYRIYEDETGTAILSGSMAKLDDGNTTGFYSEQVTLSAANGFEKGKCYTIYISASVGGVTGTMAHTLQIEAEVDANVVSDKSEYVLSAAGVSAVQSGLSTLTAGQVNAEIVDVLRTDTIPDSYAADGAQPTFAQAVLAIQQFLMEKAVSGTTVTVKKPDGSTTAMTFTLNDGSSPTSITRAS